MRLNMLRMTHKIPHGILVYAHLAIPLASKVKLALLAINSVKLHLTACKKKMLTIHINLLWYPLQMTLPVQQAHP